MSSGKFLCISDVDIGLKRFHLRRAASAGPEVFEKDQYYFHPDHFGSSSYVTDIDGELFQHIEYFPFGET